MLQGLRQLLYRALGVSGFGVIGSGFGVLGFRGLGCRWVFAESCGVLAVGEKALEWLSRAGFYSGFGVQASGLGLFEGLDVAICPDVEVQRLWVVQTLNPCSTGMTMFEFAPVAFSCSYVECHSRRRQLLLLIRECWVRLGG